MGIEHSVTAGGATGSLAAESLLRPIGRSGITTSPLTLGAAVFGWTVPNGRAKDLLDRYTAVGGTMVDTADSYASGMSEQIIGSWMRERKNRDQIVLATKVGRHPDNEGLSGRNIRAAVDASLERLQTDCIDLLYFHADDVATPLEESLAAVGELIDAGKVKSLAIMDAKPSTLYPNVPTLKSATGSNWTMAAWRGVLAPKGLPAPVQAKLAEAVRKAVASKEYNDFMTSRGLGVIYGGPDDMAKFMAKSDAEMGVTMKAVGLVK